MTQNGLALDSNITAGYPSEMGFRKPKLGMSLGDTHPQLVTLWHPTKNGALTPSAVGAGSAKKVWWLCEKGHTHEQAIRKKAAGQRCPICFGKSASEYRNLKTEQPEVAALWHPTKNGDKCPEDFLPRSNKKAWWLCPEGHEWQAVICSVNPDSCPECFELRRSKYLTEEGARACLKDTHPHLLREVDKTREDVAEIGSLYPGSTKAIWWTCGVSHTWQARLHKRVSGQGCPYCANQRVDKTNCLATLFPELMEEWAFDLNDDLNPQKISPGTNQRAWWRCNRGHVWSAIVLSRTRRGTGCPSCNPQTSKTEVRALAELEYVIQSPSKWREKISGYEADVQFPDLMLAVEIDGYPWHDADGSFERDSIKTQVFQEHGFTTIRLRDYRLRTIPNVRNVPMDERKLHESMKALIEALLELELPNAVRTRCEAYLKSAKMMNGKRYREIVTFLPGPEPQKSLAALHPEIAAEWVYDKNAPLTPDLVHAVSGMRAWWRCEKGHEWDTTIAMRTSGGTGCPYCRGLRTASDDSLEVLYPALASEWHPNLNGDLTPADVRPGSGKKVWWQCSKNHEWAACIVTRKAQGTGCPFCARRKASPEYNLITEFPEVGAFFDTARNGDPPTAYLPKSEKMVWWRCPNGHTWERKIDTQVKSGPRCAKCVGGENAKRLPKKTRP